MALAIVSTQVAEVSSTSAKFTNAMEPGFQYQFTCDVNCWVRVTVTGGAAEADTANNTLYIAGQVLFLANPDVSGSANAFVHVIRDSSDGSASLGKVQPAQ